MNKLIIAEKPSVAQRIAASLAEGPYKQLAFNGIRYYEITNGGEALYVVAAAGHLFTIKQKDSAKGFPIFDIEWAPSYKVNASAYFTKKYLDVINEIGRKCSIFINACDYDIEGTVIGTNIIRFITGKDVNSSLNPSSILRMKFSTTTKEDLVDSYKNINQFDKSNFDAGEARHMLDWMWGINLSRALMRSLFANGIKKVISIGRVQGPSLAILSKRELEIKNFVSKPYWKIYLLSKGVEFENKRGEIYNESTADEILKKSKAARTVVKEVEKKENYIRPYPPFDLTSLQLEASRVFGIDPTKTLAIAQSLYERAYISYPRTSSQKLPYTLNLPRIIMEISKNEKYKALAETLIKERRFKPAEGQKEDEAHPAIFPTGIAPKELSQEEEKIYDLIVKRFLACFADYATIENTKVTLDAEGEIYAASGEVNKKLGWMDLYKPYVQPKNNPIDKFIEKEEAKAEKIFKKSLKTLPPKRYTKAGLIALLERKDLGTKATRAEIIDTLFKRGYISGSSITVTDFGMSVYKALSESCKEILDEELTRKLENDMQGIIHNKTTKEAVINEGKEIISKIISEFKENEVKIGKSLKQGLDKSANSDILGKCTCGGDLVIRRSNKGNSFVGCTNWPTCKITYPLPHSAKIVPTGKVCEVCHTPKVKVFRRGRKVFEMCLDPNCPTKKDWGKNTTSEEPLQVKTALELKETGATTTSAEPEPKASRAKSIKRIKKKAKR
ncbi:MAG: DNA topoisomerase I [Candidatus Micrarchaeia archaeon]